MNIDWPQLRAAAVDVAGRAYAPYSRLRVGAAGLTSDGRLVVGCNVENASYGITQCAEGSAIGAMVTAGDRRIVEVVYADVDPVLWPAAELSVRAQLDYLRRS